MKIRKTVKTCANFTKKRVVYLIFRSSEVLDLKISRRVIFTNYNLASLKSGSKCSSRWKSLLNYNSLIKLKFVGQELVLQFISALKYYSFLEP